MTRSQAKPSQPLLTILPFYLIIIVLALIICWPLFSLEGEPWGTDTHGHLARVSYFAETVAATGKYPQWFPDWYMGTPFTQYYPPLVTILMGFIQILTNNLTLTYVLFAFLSLTLAGIFMFHLALEWFDPLPALISAFAYQTAQYNLYTVFDEGNMPKTLTVVLAPLWLFLAIKILNARKKGTLWLLSLATAALILSHHQQSAMVLTLAYGAILIQWQFSRTDGRENNRRIFTIGLFSFVGVLMCAFWLLPALTNADYATVPNLSAYNERVPLYSLDWKIFNPMSRFENIEQAYLGMAVFCFATLSLVFNHSRQFIALYLMSLLSIFLAFGLNNPVYQYLPIRYMLLPERFLNVTMLLMAPLCGSLAQSLLIRLREKDLQVKWVYGGLIALVVLFLGIDSFSYWRYPRLVDYIEARFILSKTNPPDALSRLDARILGSSFWSLLPIENSNQSLSYGWSIETTPHYGSFTHINYALRKGFPAFIRKLYSAWNVNDAIITNDDRFMIDELLANGFSLSYEHGTLSILSRDDPVGFVTKLKSNSIAIGRGATTTSLVYPWFSMSPESDLSRYETEYLQQFDLFYFYDFEINKKAESEAVIRDLVSQGKTVVVDLTGMPYESLFGVWTTIAAVPPVPEFRTGDSLDFEVEELFSQPMGSVDNPWRGTGYYGLDGAFLELETDAGWLPIMGYKQLPEGKVYFLGFNLIPHIIDTHDQATRKVIEEFFNRASPEKEFDDLESIPIHSMTPPADEWTIAVELEEAGAVQLSETWSPHWKAYENGLEVSIYEHENLMLLILPEGWHELTFQYQRTPIQWFGIGVSLFGLILLVYLGLRWDRISQKVLDQWTQQASE